MSTRFLLGWMMSLVAILAGCARHFEPIDAADLDKAFVDDFGFHPAPGVTELRCRIVSIGDTSARWFFFKCDESTFKKIVAGGFIEADSSILDTPWKNPKVPDVMEKNPNAPKWWPESPRKNMKRFYYIDKPANEGGLPRESAFAYLWTDEASKTVYARFSSWH